MTFESHVVPDLGLASIVWLGFRESFTCTSCDACRMRSVPGAVTSTKGTLLCSGRPGVNVNPCKGSYQLYEDSFETGSGGHSARRSGCPRRHCSADGS